MGLEMVVLLVICGVETNPGLQVEQVKTDQISVYPTNEGKGTDVLGPKFKWLNEMVNKVNYD